MRRWELIAGGSAKFWEIGQDGSAVTVRFGRLETAGQTKTKELTSPEAAQAHAAKLVAEKEKKGYQEVGSAAAPATPAPAPGSTPALTAPAPTPNSTPAPTPNSTPAPTTPAPTPSSTAAPTASAPAPSSTATPTAAPEAPKAPEAEPPTTLDENIWTIPRAWLRDVVRQRGFTPAPEFSVDHAKAAEARKQVTEQADLIERALTSQSSKAELVTAARDHLAGRPSPVGAAAIAAITSSGPASVHAWVADHGVAFAAAAVVEYLGLTFSAEWHERRGKFINVRLQPLRGGLHVSVNEPEGRMLTAVRYAIAVADDASRAQAEAALQELGNAPAKKELRSYLVPSRADWFADVCAQSYSNNGWWMLPCSASSREDYAKTDQSLASLASILYTAAYVLGPAIAPLLAEELDNDYQLADSRKQVLKVLAALPTDEAFTILLDRLDTKYVRPAVLSAMAAFPRRAARLLAERVSSSEQVRLLLKAHLLTNPTLSVPAEVTAVLAESDAEVLHDAGADQLPPVLASPPWLNRRPAVKPVVLADLPVPSAAVVWEAGERERWLEAGSDWYEGDVDWRKLRGEYEAGRIGYYDDNVLFLLAPEDEVRHLLANWKPSHPYGFDDWGKRLAARFGVDAVPALLRLARSTPGTGGAVLLPFATAEVAAAMADWLVRSKQARRWGIEWLARHRELAARLLIPVAAGKAGTPRRNAEAAVRHLHGIGVDVAAVARSVGAETAIDVVLSVDPLDVLPSRLPVIGEWADPRLLPRVLLRDRGSALSAEATRHLMMTAALSKPGDVYAGLQVVREALDRDSLATFAWAVYDAWQQAGAPSKESWALSALGWFGDDSTVRALSPLIRAWPGESQHARAVAGLDVLADIGTEVALSHLNSIAEKVSFKGLKTRAQEKVTQIAAELGLSRDQLSDRLVPRLGLDDAATLVIDYGPRQFTVGFDEQLKPYVLDPDGKRRKDLPKPGAKDDQDRAPLEHKRFMALKKDVRTIAADQIHRLERAMVAQRTWTAEEFQTVLAGHPLLWHLVRRLVWITDEGVSFRLAEDRTLANAGDDEFTLPENATVRVAHPVDLQDALQAWGEVFADYEILQPFPQLGRPVHLLASREDLLPRLKKYCGTAYPVGRILGLTKKGWVRGEPQDAGVECWITRPFPDGAALVLSLEPGIAVGAVDEFPEVGFDGVWFSLSGRGDWSAPKDTPPTYDVDAITISELLCELESLHS